jgi:hypothetical protein
MLSRYENKESIIIKPISSTGKHTPNTQNYSKNGDTPMMHSN